MKLCIISDLHCKYQLDTTSFSDTLLFSNLPRLPYKKHPVEAMLKAIDSDHNINGDILLFLGDLGDKADEQGIATAWSLLEEIRVKMNIPVKIGIPGNHDVNSRKKQGKDAFSFIKNFNPTFPTSDEKLNGLFWGDGYCIQTVGEALFLLINTVHDHEDQEKAEISSIDGVTLEKIESELKSIPSENIKFRVCMLHHHPIKHSNIMNYRDSDSLDNGDKLISLLNLFGFNIVLHGHKHQPRIKEDNGLPIFAAGSFSSIANLTGTGINTMFHIVELKENSKKGVIHSWEFDIMNGWMASQNIRFPAKIGYGGILDIDEVADEINTIFSKDSVPKLYQEILNLYPQLDFLIPEKLLYLEKILKERYNIVVDPSFPFVPRVISLK